MACTWKENRTETQQHYIDWWNHRGLVLASWRLLTGRPAREGVLAPEPVSLDESYANPDWRARFSHFDMACHSSAGDILPIADNDIGPGSLALYLGCEPDIARDTVWFNAFISNPDNTGPICFDPNNRWWQISAASLEASMHLSQGRYLVGCPDLVENLDILASMRGVEPLLTDLIDRPDWVIEKVHEINRAWFEIYSRVYDIIKLEDGSSAFSAFRLWGPGKTAKLQCDFSASISPRMFRKFVVPVLTEQCNWLDHSMFHLDGHQCIAHLDLLLSIENLDAIEWTPDPTVPPGGSPRWYEMYRKILAAGNSVQAIGVKPPEILPLLDAVGGKGLMIIGEFASEQEYENCYKMVEPYR